MSGWQVGDLALCVQTPPHSKGLAPNPCKKGRVYTVEAVVYNDRGTQGLRFVGVEFSRCKLNAIGSRFYRKVTPPAADAFDREIIALMASKPVPAEPVS